MGQGRTPLGHGKEERGERGRVGLDVGELRRRWKGEKGFLAVGKGVEQ